MNWLTFFSYTGMGYAAYYLVVLLIDSRASPSGGGEPVVTVLNFAEEEPLEKVVLADLAPVIQPGEVGSGSPASVGLGGVSMQGFFELARTEALQYTRSVSF